uniref:Peptidase A2 domain-containing protein n=1 Tax=Lepisosteus oculatus TaxID=7918 RepID=W5LVU0_LEPOC
NVGLPGFVAIMADCLTLMEEASRALTASVTVQWETNELQRQAQGTLQAQISTVQIFTGPSNCFTGSLPTDGRPNSDFTPPPAPASPAPAQVQPSHILQKMMPEDNVEAYLRAFEQTAECLQWDRNLRASIVAPFLCGEAQKAYYDLNSASASDCTRLKAEILDRERVMTRVRALRLHQWCYDPRVSYVVLNVYLQQLPPKLQRSVAQRDPQTVDDFMTSLEKHLAAANLAGRDEDATILRRIQGSSLYTRCAIEGHESDQCLAEDTNLDCNIVHSSRNWHKGTVHTNPPVELILFNGQSLLALVDSGSALCLVTPDVVRPHQVEKNHEISVGCIHGEQREHPVARLRLCLRGPTVVITAAVVQGLPHPLLLRRN